MQRAVGRTAEGTEPLERPSNRGNSNIVILKSATQQYVVTVWTGLIWTKIFDQWRDLLNKVMIKTSGYKRWEKGCALWISRLIAESVVNFV